MRLNAVKPLCLHFFARQAQRVVNNTTNTTISAAISWRSPDWLTVLRRLWLPSLLLCQWIKKYWKAPLKRQTHVTHIFCKWLTPTLYSNAIPNNNNNNRGCWGWTTIELLLKNRFPLQVVIPNRILKDNLSQIKFGTHRLLRIPEPFNQKMSSGILNNLSWRWRAQMSWAKMIIYPNDVTWNLFTRSLVARQLPEDPNSPGQKKRLFEGDRKWVSHGATHSARHVVDSRNILHTLSVRI